MAALTITLPDPTTEWAERRAGIEGFPSIDAYLGNLVERQRVSSPADDWPEQPELTIEDLRRIVEEARASDPNGKTIADIIAEGDRIAKARGFHRE